MNEFDLVVIGGGSGGVRAARIAAGYGAKVALVEEYRMGGTCVIRGCVPKKLMVYASRFVQEFEEAEGFGWTLGEKRFDWSTLKTHRDAEVARLEGIYRSNLVKAGVHIFAGRARLANATTVALSDGQQLSTRHILIATGGKPVNGPSFPGSELTIDSNGFFDLEHMPKQVVVQGAGYIALELACVLQLLGATVHVVVRGDQILRGFDDETRKHLAGELIANGMHFHFGREVHAVAKSAAGLEVLLDNGETLPADCVLRAIGRAPLTQDLGLENAGVALNAQGAIAVDAFSQTTAAGIYAVGDVTHRFNLTPMAIREGHAFADTVFGKRPRSVDYTLIPTGVFTTPEVGVVGLTEEQALKRFPQLDVYSTSFRPLKATLSGHHSKTFLKLLVDRATDRVVGFHSVGPDTGEMAQLMGVALQMQATKSALDATLAVHPTAAEELVTMRTPTRQHNV
jgi:glutathione reductase (NADPH)